MKFALIALMLVSSTAFAGLRDALSEVEVEQLETKMNDKGFKLTNALDVYADRGVYPRCPCQSYELTFSKRAVTAGVMKKIDKKFSVSVEGFGPSKKVSIFSN
ncbi:MAG: hypothetical protein K2P81_09645 [Bacteriovoracaceae bacterium]|nr:hypothetical protein [Bacteriovoracaceae bacterium]